MKWVQQTFNESKFRFKHTFLKRNPQILYRDESTFGLLLMNLYSAFLLLTVGSRDENVWLSSHCIADIETDTDFLSPLF